MLPCFKLVIKIVSLTFTKKRQIRAIQPRNDLSYAKDFKLN